MGELSEEEVKAIFQRHREARKNAVPVDPVLPPSDQGWIDCNEQQEPPLETVQYWSAWDAPGGSFKAGDVVEGCFCMMNTSYFTHWKPLAEKNVTQVRTMNVLIAQHGDSNIIQVSNEGESLPFVGGTGTKEPRSDCQDPITEKCLYYAIERIAELEAERKGCGCLKATHKELNAAGVEL